MLSSHHDTQGREPGLLLGIDSATAYLALSLVRTADGAEVARFCEELGREHAARIMGELGALLKRAGAERQDIVGVGVGVGPGSYTGVRIGLATALALGRAWGVPVGGSSSLLALLAGLTPGQQGVALLDARRENVYALAGVRTATVTGTAAPFVEPVGQPLKLPRTDVPRLFAGLPVFEGPPDASVLARRALLGGPTTAYYL